MCGLGGSSGVTELGLEAAGTAIDRSSEPAAAAAAAVVVVPDAGATTAAGGSSASTRVADEVEVEAAPETELPATECLEGLREEATLPPADAGNAGRRVGLGAPASGTMRRMDLPSVFRILLSAMVEPVMAANSLRVLSLTLSVSASESSLCSSWIRLAIAMDSICWNSAG